VAISERLTRLVAAWRGHLAQWSWRGWVARGFAAVTIVLVLVVAGWMARQAWAVHQLHRGIGDTWFHTADGERWFRLDEQRYDVPLARIAPHLQQAFIAVEDHRFYLHPGLDPIAFGRAVVRNLRTGSMEGASTLTQQLARTLFLSNQKSVGRKAREAVIALLMEAQLTKPQILELYLNRIYLSGGVYGVEAMAQRAFGKSASDLSLAESAFIAGLARAPGALSPWSNREGAVARSHVVLARMEDAGFITEEEGRAARKARLRIRPYRAAATARDGYARDYVRQQFRNVIGGGHPPDWRVDTTIVAALQRAAERSVDVGLRRFGQPDLQAALVALDPATGDVLALVGGRDYAASAFNRAVRSQRQPGSAFKPLVYAAALEQGYSPATVLEGLTTLTPQGPDEWAPENASGGTADTLPLRTALVESNNRAASLLQQRIGARRVLALATRAGLDDLPDVPSLALGTGLVSPLDLTAAYSMFPGGGTVVRPRGIVRILDEGGSVAMQSAVQTERVLSPEVAWQMVSMLGDVVDRGTATRVRRLGVRAPVGGKTGTTDDFHDAWFVGFSSNLVVGVWVGHDQPRTIARNAFGARYALPIWADFMRRAVAARRPEAFERPASLEGVTLCRVSARQPVQGCPVYTEWFKPADDRPSQLCRVHRGTMRQRVERAVEGWFSSLGRRVRDVFK